MSEHNEHNDEHHGQGKEEPGDTYEIEEASAEPASHPGAECDNCGSPRAEDGEPVCVPCGHDHKTGKVVGTKTGIANAPQQTAQDPLVSNSAIRIWLGIALVATLVLVVAWFAGWSSLFQRSDGKFLAASGDYTLDTPRFVGRILGVIRWIVAGITLTLVGSLAMRITAMIASRPAGSWGSVCTRVALVVATSGLATLIPLEPMWLERIVQLLVGVGLAVLGSLLVLRLRGAHLGIFLAAWVLLLAALLPVARLVAWSFGA